MCFGLNAVNTKMESDSIEIRNSKFGKGLFAIHDIEPGAVLYKVSGNEKEMNLYETTLLNEKESHAIQIDFDRYLLCEPPFLYSNHSCNPNCAINEKLEMFALKKIKAGEELFWDYSTSMLERHWTMKCSCGEKNCRKIIKDFDLLPKYLQRKYLEMNIVLPFIVHFIQYQRAKSA
jgi:hypothetical protein